MLERYVIIERIAVGGMGEVFVARQEGVGNFRRTVVLKKLLKDTEGSEEAVERMLDEARINGALSHENVVAIIEDDWREEGWSAPGHPDVLASRFAGWHARARSLIGQCRIVLLSGGCLRGSRKV